MAELSSKEKVKFTSDLRELWESGRFKTRRALASYLGVPYQQVQKALAGRLYKQGTVKNPKGNCKPVTLYGKTYFVYDDGRVWSTESNRLVGSHLKLGYKIVGVVNPTTKKLENFRVSRLMLELFVRPPKPGEWARHLDDDPQNNTLPNLAWGSPQDNSDDCVRNGHSLKGERANKAKLTNENVKTLVAEYDGSPYKTFAKSFVARHQLSVGVLAVVRVLRGQNWTHITGWRRRSQKTNAKLDRIAVRAVHRNFQRLADRYTLSAFAEKYTEHLRKMGYSVKVRAVANVIRGESWPDVYEEFWT